MSKSKKARFVPSYRLHKPSGQARVIIDGEHIYLGPYGSPESHEKYARLIAERAVTTRTAKPRGRVGPMARLHQSGILISWSASLRWPT